jgi:hypothetical protein
MIFPLDQLISRLYKKIVPTLMERDIVRLERKIAREEDRMSEISDDFFKNGGVCCPSCGVPGYSDLQYKQERRERWLKILKAKRDSGHA